MTVPGYDGGDPEEVIVFVACGLPVDIGDFGDEAGTWMVVVGPCEVLEGSGFDQAVRCRGVGFGEPSGLGEFLRFCKGKIVFIDGTLYLPRTGQRISVVIP